MICKHILLIIFLNEPEFIFLHTVKWFQALLSNTNNSIFYVMVYKMAIGECSKNRKM